MPCISSASVSRFVVVADAHYGNQRRRHFKLQVQTTCKLHWLLCSPHCAHSHCRHQMVLPPESIAAAINSVNSMQVACFQRSPPCSLFDSFAYTGSKTPCLKCVRRRSLRLEVLDSLPLSQAFASLTALAAILRLCSASQKLDFQTSCLSQLQVIVEQHDC